MRSDQSWGFRLHFGQHDKAAAGGNGASVSVRKPSTWTRAAEIQLQRKERRGDQRGPLTHPLAGAAEQDLGALSGPAPSKLSLS